MYVRSFTHALCAARSANSYTLPALRNGWHINLRFTPSLSKVNPALCVRAGCVGTPVSRFLYEVNVTACVLRDGSQRDLAGRTGRGHLVFVGVYLG